MGARSSRRKVPVYNACGMGGYGGGYGGGFGGGYPSVAFPPPMPSTYGTIQHNSNS